MSPEERDARHSGSMKRRDFLRKTGLGGALAFGGSAVLGGAAFGRTGEDLPAESQGETAARRPPLPAFELEETTIAELSAAMKAGKHTARSLVDLYLARIAAIDKAGPGVNSVIEVNPDAVAAADGLDSERRSGRVRGPLHGIPVLVKDNIDSADRMQTTAGSLALAGRPPGEDAFIVTRLRDAGAVILGKTNLSEWANFRSVRSSGGWSGRGGQTRNPYALDRNPCGSSSGSGVAVASNLCAAAVGTETDGSIVCPSSANSVVGIKPTLGLVSRSGIVPIAHSQDTAGPMARTVADAAVLLGALAGTDPRDPVTGDGAGRSHGDYTRFLDPGGLAGARIGVVRNLMVAHEKVVALVEEALAALKAGGAIVVDPADIPNADQLDKPEFEVLLYEFKADLNAYLAARGGGSPAGSLEELIAYNEANREREMPYFGQELFTMAQEKGPLTSEAYLTALATARRLARDEGIDAVMREHSLDALVAATGGPPWPTDLVNGDHYSGGCSTPAAVAGYPHITVPLGYVHGLPVGFSFFGAAFSEPVLLKIAYAFERATAARRAPRFLATADLT